jgi:hypothetical protein
VIWKKLLPLLHFTYSAINPAAVLGAAASTMVRAFSFTCAEHLALHRRQDNDVRFEAFDYAKEDPAFLVMHPDIFAGMEAEIAIPESVGE